ncbi:MAG: hypothetical protein RJA10_2684 [Pseudomonadota bacterium]|jgi:DNA polymerase
MSWSARQRHLLREMGLTVWQPDSPPPAPVAAVVAAPEQAPRAAPPPARAPAAVAAAAAAPTPIRPAAAPVALQAAEPPPPRRPAPPDPADDERSQRIATLDWPALRSAVADCQACGLCGSRKQTVFGVGHPQARWMVVGEAPGEQEDLQGQPFVGPSGELLDSMLRALKLTRATDGPEPPTQRVYIANTLKCRPPRNRNPEPAEMLACEPFLIRQIALLKPQIILAMGRFAVQALLRSSEPVGKLRGQVHTYQGVPLVVTYHPAYLLRNLPDKARAWDDLCLAASVAASAAQA